MPQATLAQPRAFCALEASFPKVSAVAERTPANHPAPRVINTDEHAAYPPAVAQLKAEGALAEDCRHRLVPYLNNHARAGPPRHQAPDSRKPAFPLVLGSLAHDRRLRSDPYDPQRPGVRKRAGCEGRSTPLLHSRFVQRGDGLILRTLSPNFALTPKLQHYPALYCRISTADQTSERDLRAFAKKAGYKVVGVWKETAPGQSRSGAERKKVLALARARKVDVTRWDRSARFAARSLACFKFRFVSSPLVGQRHELLIGGGDPNLVQVWHVSHRSGSAAGRVADRPLQPVVRPPCALGAVGRHAWPSTDSRS